MFELKKFSKDELSKISRPKLVLLARRRGIDVAESDSVELLVQKMLSFQEQETEAEKAESEVIEQRIKGSDDDRVWFKIMAGTQPHEKHDVFASINGDSILVKRNHWVKLPKKFLSVFENAMESMFEMESDDSMVERKVPRFNIQVRPIVSGVSPDGKE